MASSPSPLAQSYVGFGSFFVERSVEDMVGFCGLGIRRTSASLHCIHSFSFIQLADDTYEPPPPPVQMAPIIFSAGDIESTHFVSERMTTILLPCFLPTLLVIRIGCRPNFCTCGFTCLGARRKTASNFGSFDRFQTVIIIAFAQCL
jgi:hypothetical protein